MSSAITWTPEDLLSTNSAQASNLVRNEAFDSQLNSLKDVAMTLLSAVESLKASMQRRGERKISLNEEVRRFEADLIRAALVRSGGNQARAARLLGVKHTTLNAKIKRYGIATSDRQVEDRTRDEEVAA